MLHARAGESLFSPALVCCVCGPILDSALILLYCKINAPCGNSLHFFKVRSCMALEPGRRPVCTGINVNKYGTTSDENQRYICWDKACPGKTFLLEYSDLGRLPEIKE